MVAKESPLKGMPVVEYIEKKVSGWQKEAVRKLHDLVHQAAPTVKSAIKWGQPVFDHNGPFAFVKPAKGHVTFGFWRGGELHDPTGILSGAGERMRHFKVTALEQIDENAFVQMVKHAVQLNTEKGNPTMGAKRKK